MGGEYYMKNKFKKCFNLGLCCILFSVLISTYIPQNDTVVLTSNKSITARLFSDDPPFH